MTTQQHLRLGRQTAFISFLLGTGIFGMYFLTALSEWLFVGFGFIALAGLVNVGIFTSLVVKAGKDKENSKKLGMTGGLMLLNIPVMLAYCQATMMLLNTMRITFTNATPTTLTNIQIVGCGGGHIDKLEIGASKTVWVKITGDCSISLAYASNGQQKVEIVAGYVTSNLGQKMKHAIGGQHNASF